MAVFPTFQDFKNLLKSDKHPKNDLNLQLTLIDVVLNFALFTPLIVLHYQSTSTILERLSLTLIPYVPLLQSLLQLCIGLLIQISIAFYQQKIRSFLKGVSDLEVQDILRLCSPCVYNFILGVGCISHIGGIEGLYKWFLGSESSLKTALKATSTSLAVLWALRGGRNTIAAPLCLDVSVEEDDFTIYSTLYNIEPNETIESALDIIGTVVVVHSFLHLFWVGVWSVLDATIFPNNTLLSAVSCLLLGYLLCSVILLLQNKVVNLSKQLDHKGSFRRLAFENVFYLAATTSTIVLWRGLWMMFDMAYLYFPVYHRGRDVSAIASCILSYLMLCLTYLSGSVPYKGFDKDGVEDDGEGVHLFTSYLTNLADFTTSVTPAIDVCTPVIKRPRVRSLRRRAAIAKETKAQEFQTSAAVKKVTFDPLPPSRRSATNFDDLLDEDGDILPAEKSQKTMKRPLLLSKEDMVTNGKHMKH